MTETEIQEYLEGYGSRAKNASNILATASIEIKNTALANAAKLLISNTERILA